jgi:hypothetical protein
MVTTILDNGTRFTTLPYTDEEEERLNREWFSAPPRRVLRAPRPRREPEEQRPSTERPEDPSAAREP